jgi:hypothetical protein
VISLKYVVDHLLELRYGHLDYSIELFPLDKNGNALDDGESEIAELYVNCWEVVLSDDDDQDFENSAYPVPHEVLAYVRDLLKEFRPDVTFKLAKEYEPVAEPAVFAPGFSPV